jgi:hypothetical protein
MVEQVKRRGPFLSLSDFINRRLTDDERGLSGAIQSSLDETSVPAANGLDVTTPVSLLDAPVPEHANGDVLDFAPGDLTQADVLTSIGPTIAVRSDTFVIRSYGRSEGLNQGIKGEAWCEMLVQRFPDEHSDSSMGRPFRILNFRYLTKDEI